MIRLFSSMLFSFFLLFQTLSTAEEGDIERLVVPESQDISTNDKEMPEEVTEEGLPEALEVSTETAPVSHEENEAVEPTIVSEDTPQEKQAEVAHEEPTEATEDTAQTEELPSEEELEAKHAEEAELREVGAGEEPVID